MVRFNDVVDIYVYDEKCLIRHEKFRVVFNNDAEKRVSFMGEVIVLNKSNPSCIILISDTNTRDVCVHVNGC